MCLLGHLQHVKNLLSNTILRHFRNISELFPLFCFTHTGVSYKTILFWFLLQLCGQTT